MAFGADGRVAAHCGLFVCVDCGMVTPEPVQLHDPEETRYSGLRVVRDYEGDET